MNGPTIICISIFFFLSLLHVNTYTHIQKKNNQLRALSQVLRRPFEVVQAEGRPVVVGEEFVASSSSTSSEPPVLLTYHRHMFGLGEHYNSVQPRPVEDDDDQN
jgi:hypothetical protein